MKLRKGRKYDGQARSRGSVAHLFDRGERGFVRELEHRPVVTFGGGGAADDYPPASPVFDPGDKALDAYSKAVISTVDAKPHAAATL